MNHREALAKFASRELKIAYAKKNRLAFDHCALPNGRRLVRIYGPSKEVLSEFEASEASIGRILGLRRPPPPPECKTSETISAVSRRWRFYETGRGAKPVLDFIRELPEHEQIRVRDAMRRVREEGVASTKQLNLNETLYQIPVETGAKSLRLIFSAEGKKKRVLLALLIYDKNSDKSPTHTMRLAEERVADWHARGHVES